MAILSGTTMRLRFTRPAGSLLTFVNATTMSVNHGTNTRSLIHKDNVGSHDEVTPDGLNTTSNVTFFKEDASTYSEMVAAWNAEETVVLEWHNGVVGEEKYTQSAIITSVQKTATVRESVTGTVSFTHTGALTIGTVPI